MSSPDQPPTIYRPQQIPITATYTAKEGDARRLAAAVVQLTLRARVVVAVLATLIVGAAGFLWLPGPLAAGLTVLYALVLAISTRSRMAKVTGIVENIYLVLFARPGAQMCTRFGVQGFDFECETSCSTYAYDALKVKNVYPDIVVLTIGQGPHAFPRDVIPDHALSLLQNSAS